MTRSCAIAAVALVAATAAFDISAASAAGTPPTTTTTSTSTVPSEAECAHADALASAGENAAAEKIYIGLVAKDGAPCAVDGLAALNGDTSGDRLIADVTRALKLIGSAAVVALFLVLVVVLLYVVLTWIRPVRAVMARTLLIGRLFDPTLKVEPFSDAGAKPPVGTGVTGLVRAALARLGTDQEETQQLRVDSNAGVETIASAIGGLGELAPQAKGVTSLITSLPAMARTPRYSVGGTLQLAGDAGDGLTVALKVRDGLAATTTFWWPHPAGTESPDAYYQLGAAAAGWADFVIRDREGLEEPGVTTDAMSFGYFHAAVELDRSGRTDDAHDTYLRALRYDEENVGVLLNLGLLYARENRYERALVLFLRAETIAGRSSPPGRRRWFS